MVGPGPDGAESGARDQLAGKGVRDAGDLAPPAPSLRSVRGTVTRADVAALAGVSAAVVSYALNGGPRPVSDGTRRRVMQAVETLGYRPNAVARALRLRQTSTLGLIVPDISNPYFAELAKAIEDLAYGLGYSLLLANSSDDLARERAELATFADRQVDGLIIVGVGLESVRSAVDRVDIPMVALDRMADGISTVTVDNHFGARIGVEHLMSHGHRAIACISGPMELEGARSREDGWRTALGSDPSVETPLLVNVPFTRTGGYDAARQLLNLSERPTSIFASSDLQAIGALRACHEAGLRVPEDIALVSFDGTQEAEFSNPGLTVVQQPLREIAQRAVDTVLGTSSMPPEGVIMIKPRLVIRSSCGCMF